MRRFFLFFQLAALATLAACGQSTDSGTEPSQEAAVDTPEPEDPNLWLEAVEGEEALAWVEGENERSLAQLTAEPLYEQNYAAALAVLTSDERIPYGSIRDGFVYNFWQDDTNVRGLWRRTSLAEYEKAQPDWETVLDFDALAASEDKNWVFKGSNCFRPKGSDQTRCLVSLSNGGKDAVEMREFSLADKAFVEGGFYLPEAKQGAAWVDADTLLVSTDWGGDGSTLTESGYPSDVRMLKRGQDLADTQTAYAGESTDVGVWPWASELKDGRMIYGAVESDTFFTSTFWLLMGDEPVAMPIPPKSSPGDVEDGFLFVTLQQDWSPEGQSETFQNGDLVAFELDAFLDSSELPPVELVFRANERQAVNSVSVAAGGALLSINDNVVSKILRLKRTEAGWATDPVTLPGSGRASIFFADDDIDTVFINFEGFLTPDTLLRYNSRTGEMAPLKALPALFDTDGLAVQQFEARSKDGTQVPYFVVHRADIEFDGSTPTLLYGYGGFEVSMRPSYSGTLGKMWLERGGAYALANIRGGGEFGPAWHQAGLKQNRQRIYDDFIAVGEDLIDRRITSTPRLGIMGGSNGGLLMGVMLTQRPDLWNAVVVQVPLLDMLRYDKLLAGASWVDEYGDPDVPEERAFLETISPYHNFDESAEYPTPFFVTSTKDDRVHPGHARKMAQRFQAAEKPFLYYENTDGGHSAAANQKARAKRTALEYTYLAERLMDADADTGD
ncbi:MAG: prolyl oligopeptidase family serine peptidase [Pseudomonadota bacterium]